MAVEGRGDGPPILTLLEAVEAHRGAFEYDWLNRFGVRFDPPHTTGWGESWRLYLILGGDPSSQVCAALAGWNHPAGRDVLALADLFDVTARANFKKPRPYPRPWDERPKTKGTGRRDVQGWLEFKARKQAEHQRRTSG